VEPFKLEFARNINFTFNRRWSCGIKLRFSLFSTAQLTVVRSFRFLILTPQGQLTIYCFLLAFQFTYSTIILLMWLLTISQMEILILWYLPINKYWEWSFGIKVVII